MKLSCFCNCWAKASRIQVQLPLRECLKKGLNLTPFTFKDDLNFWPFFPQQETPAFMATQPSKPCSYLQPPQFSLICPLPNLHESSSILFFSLLSLWWPLKRTKYKCVDPAM